MLKNNFCAIPWDCVTYVRDMHLILWLYKAFMAMSWYICTWWLFVKALKEYTYLCTTWGYMLIWSHEVNKMFYVMSKWNMCTVSLIWYFSGLIIYVHSMMEYVNVIMYIMMIYPQFDGLWQENVIYALYDVVMWLVA